ncbi:MAG: hypothetical protein ABS69_20560 [Nitrosomonadales bacterium SCN 54-20]|nr:MAG: hypothetical protein ABS69_20560 [Nitrosomonadales bacterium SCN 54-20]
MSVSGTSSISSTDSKFFIIEGSSIRIITINTIASASAKNSPFSVAATRYQPRRTRTTDMQ